MKRKLLSVIVIALLLAGAMHTAYALPNLASEFAYVVLEDHVEILGYEGTSPIVEVPSTIAGKPVTSVRLGKTQSDTSNRFLGVRRIILPSTVTALADSAFGYYTQLESVEGLEYIERITGGTIFTFCGLQEAHFSTRLREVATDAFMDSDGLLRVTLPDDAVYHERALSLGGVSELTLLRGENEPTIKLENGVVYSADGKRLKSILPLMHSPYYAIAEGTECIEIGAFSSALYLEELDLPASISSIPNDAGGLYLLDHDVTVRAPQNSYAFAFYQDYIANGGTDASNLTLEPLDHHDGVTLSSRVEQILSQCLTAGMTDIQKARALHDWICAFGSYDYSLTRFSASDMLIDGCGVCDAYTRAYCVLLEAAGIESRRIPCAMDVVGHAITAIRINGEWMYVDITNNDEGFGHPADLFGFNDDIYRAFYTENTGLSANTLAYYPPYATGELTPALDALTEQITNQMQLGHTRFTVALSSETTPIRAAALCSLLEDQLWTYAGNDYTLVCSTENNRNFQCLLTGAVESPAFSYFTNDRGNLTLTAYHGDATAVVVPETIDGMTVDALSSTFDSNRTITSVTLPESIQEIGPGTFYNCTSLEHVNLPAALTNIGDFAFFGCVQLKTDLAFAEGLASIGDSAFSMCYNVKSAVIPGTAATLGKAIFSQCSSLKSVTLGEGITTLPTLMFCECTHLRKVLLPHSLLAIGEAAFERSGVSAIHIPANVSDIHWGAFVHAEQLTSLTVDEENDHYAVQDQMLLTRDMKTLVASTLAIAPSPVIPSGVEAIGEYAFTHNKTLQSIRIPSHVKVIGPYAFSESSLTSVYMEDGVEKIGEHAFTAESVWVGSISGYASTWLRTLRLPNTLTEIGEGAFFGHHPGLAIILPSSLTRIDVSFITGNRHLYIPESITCIAPQNIAYPWDEMVIHGVPGSYAETFAAAHGYRFESTVDIMELNAESITLLEKVTFPLTVKTLNGKDAADIADEITWASDSDCVSVTDGVVTAHHMGHATVTASWQGVSAQCEITVAELTRLDQLYYVGNGGTLLRINEARDCFIYGSVNQPQLTQGEWNTVQAFIELTQHGLWSVSDPTVLKLMINENTVKAVAIGAGTCTVTVRFPTGESASLDFVVAAAQVVDPDECTHVAATAPALKPTCQTEGLTEGSYCELCGKIFVAQDVIPAPGHKLVMHTTDFVCKEGDVLSLGDFADACAHFTDCTITGAADHPDKLAVMNHALCALDAGYTAMQLSIMLPDGFCKVIDVTALIHANEVVTLPASLTEIGEEAFAHVAAEEFILPVGVTSIGPRAFAHSEAKLIHIPASVTSIAEDAFAGCQATLIVPADSFAAAFAQEHGIAIYPCPSAF